MLHYIFSLRENYLSSDLGVTMSKLIMYVSICCAVIGTTTAHAVRLDTGNNTMIYIDLKSGKQISAVEADRTATLDGEVLGCKPMEKVCNQRTGKCTLKNVK